MELLKQYFSLAEGRFLDSVSQGDDIPAGCVEVPQALYCELMAAQSQGKLIVAGPDGQPVAIDPQPSIADPLWAAQIKQVVQQTLGFSPTVGGFFDLAIHGNAIPPDCVEVTQDQHRELMEAQSLGQVIVAGPDGRPVAVDPPPPTDDQRWAAYRAQAQLAIDKTDMVALRCFKSGVEFPAEWKSYVTALRTIVSAKNIGDYGQPLPIQPDYPAGT